MGDTIQKAEELQVTEAKVVKVQKPSASYTLKSMGENNKKLVLLGLITEKEYTELEKMRTKAKEEWIKNL